MFSNLRRHWSVLSHAWRMEASVDRRRVRQSEFLPAALEIIETPASPLARIGLWLLIGGVFAALAWSVVGRLDVVVAAPGRIIPADRVKLIQATELGSVRAIHVADGQRVRAGQLLLELDPTAAGADDDQARTGLQAARIDDARNRALLSYLRGGSGQLRTPTDVPSSTAETQRDLLSTQIAEYQARRAMLVQTRLEHAADLAASLAERRKLEETIPLLDRQIEARERLVAQGHFPRLRLYELQEQRVERARNVEVQAAAAGKARAGIAGVDAQLAQLRSELARSTTKDLAEAQDNARLRASEIAKTGMRNRMLHLRSPVNGIVQQLKVHTIGGVVQPAETLLIVVPDGSQLVVDAKILNKDVGFVAPGQGVRVKVDAFPFTDHGVLHGRLEAVSGDAVEDDKLGLVYTARVRLDKHTPGERRISVAPGMTVVAEIRTARRRVIDYLLSPLSTRLDEAGRER